MLSLQPWVSDAKLVVVFRFFQSCHLSKTIHQVVRVQNDPNVCRKWIILKWEGKHSSHGLSLQLCVIHSSQHFLPPPHPNSLSCSGGNSLQMAFLPSSANPALGFREQGRWLSPLPSRLPLTPLSLRPWVIHVNTLDSSWTINLTVLQWHSEHSREVYVNECTQSCGSLCEHVPWMWQACLGIA